MKTPMQVNFSGIRDSSALGKVLRAPLRLVPKDLCVPVVQGPLRGTWWIAGSSNHGCWLGSYEFEKQRLFAKLIKPGDVVWDIGANVGFYTLLAARLTGGSGWVVAIEPLPENVRYLRRHIELNRITNALVLEMAVGQQRGRAHFQVGQNRSMGTLAEGREGIMVDVAQLDDLASDGRIPPPRVVKMDIEGGELEALRGARNSLLRSKPIVLLATHSRTLHSECTRYLQSLEYVVAGVGRRDANDTDELLATPQ